MLPLLLTAIMLFGGNQPPAGAIEHGELFLAAANGIVVGVVALGSRSGARRVVPWLVSVLFLLLLAVPCYAVWAMLTVRALARENLNIDFSVYGGWGVAIVAALVSLGMSVLGEAPALAKSGSRA